MIYGDANVSPYEGDEIYEDFNPPPEGREKPEIENEFLDEVLEKYECWDLLPLAAHVAWLSSVKEALGTIPFNLDYDTIRYLVILHEEAGKKHAKDMQDMKDKK